MSSLAQETLMGSSSVETEIIAATAAVDIAIDEGQHNNVTMTFTITIANLKGKDMSAEWRA